MFREEEGAGRCHYRAWLYGSDGYPRGDYTGVWLGCNTLSHQYGRVAGLWPENPPYWAFEKGVYLEKFDSIFQVEASIKADTAYFFNKEELWKLMGNVHIQNLKGEQFDTELLYWDQRAQRIYSDEFIRIEQPDRIITGHGFESNQQMTVYTIRKPEGIFYVDEETAAADSLQTDTINW